MDILKVQKNKKKVIAIIPAYNEAKNITSVITTCQRFVDEVIVIDDGSQDKTANISHKAGAAVLVNEVNRGKAASLNRGIKRGLEEEGSVFIFLDSDGQHDPCEIPLFLEKINLGYDLVIGKRKFDAKTMPIIRVLANFISSSAVSFSCKSKIEDSQSGYRAAKRQLLENISFTSNRFQIDTEMIIKSAKCGYRIGFVPIKTIYHMNAKSKVHQIIDPLKCIFLIIKLSFWKCPGK